MEITFVFRPSHLSPYTVMFQLGKRTLSSTGTSERRGVGQKRPK